jgi:hypothetical protein
MRIVLTFKMKVISVSVKILPHPMAVQAASFIVVNQGLHRFIFQNITLITLHVGQP